jgi:hypothetical protein
MRFFLQKTARRFATAAAARNDVIVAWAAGRRLAASLEDRLSACASGCLVAVFIALSRRRLPC